MTDAEKAVRTLRENREEVVKLQADKGGKTVVMDKEDYARKLEESLKGEVYSALKKDPTMCENRKLVNVENGNTYKAVFTNCTTRLMPGRARYYFLFT